MHGVEYGKQRWILLSGRRWQIGDSLSTKIWHDSWVPGFHTFSYPPQLSEEESKDFPVNYLFTASSHAWDVDKVTNIFPPREASKILKINLGLYPRLDKWIWSEEKSENFVVKSAYHLLQTSH